MKNSDTPAMPFEPSLGDQYFTGLTKREMFAMNAPERPSWFVDHWLKDNYGKYKCEDGHSINPWKSISSEGMFNLAKDWRYAYADMMLED